MQLSKLLFLYRFSSAHVSSCLSIPCPHLMLSWHTHRCKRFVFENVFFSDFRWQSLLYHTHSAMPSIMPAQFSLKKSNHIGWWVANILKYNNFCCCETCNWLHCSYAWCLTPSRTLIEFYSKQSEQFPSNDVFQPSCAHCGNFTMQWSVFVYAKKFFAHFLLNKNIDILLTEEFFP